MKGKRIKMIEMFSASYSISDCLNVMLSKMSGSIVHGTIPTGFSILNEYLNGGLRPGQLLIIGANPQSGKTSFVVSMIRRMLGENKKIIFFSFELSAVAISRKLIAAISDLSLSKIIHENIGEDNYAYARVMNTAEYLYPKSFHIIDLPMITMKDLEKLARIAFKMDKLDCLLIDSINYIDLKANSSAAQYGKIARRLKKLALELQIPIIATIQFSSDNTRMEPPSTCIFSDEELIVQESDIFLSLKERIDTEEGKRKNMEDNYDEKALQSAEIIVRKNRNGTTGKFVLGYNSKTAAFENIDHDVFPVESLQCDDTQMF